MRNYWKKEYSIEGIKSINRVIQTQAILILLVKLLIFKTPTKISGC